MVKVVLFLKSFLFEISLSSIPTFSRFAFLSTWGGKTSGNPYSNIMACISVLSSPGFPKDFIIFPNGDEALLGQSLKCTITLSPFLKSFNSSASIKKSVNTLEFRVLTKPKSFFLSRIPIKSFVALCNISTTSPSFLPFFLLLL